MAGRRQQILADLRSQFGELVGLDLAAADPEARFLELGFDSLCLTQAAAVVKNHFGARVTFRQLNQDLSSLGALSRYLDSVLPESVETGAASPPAPGAVADPKSSLPSPGTPKTLEHAGEALVKGQGNVEVPARDATGASQNSLEEVIQDQLKVMEMQLALLRGEALQEVTPHRPREQAQVDRAVPPPSAESQHDSAASSLHGPFRPRERSREGGLERVQQTHLNWFVPRYVSRTRKSKEHTQRYRQKFADPRVVAGFNPSWKEMVYPIVATRSLEPTCGTSTETSGLT